MVGPGAPVDGEGFEIARMVGVGGPVLHRAPQLLGQAKRIGIPTGLMEGGEAVDREGLGVEMFVGSGRRAICGHGPEDAPMLWIDQMRGDETPGP